MGNNTSYAQSTEERRACRSCPLRKIAQIVRVTGKGKMPGLGPQVFGPSEFTDYNLWTATS